MKICLLNELMDESKEWIEQGQELMSKIKKEIGLFGALIEIYSSSCINAPSTPLQLEMASFPHYPCGN